MSESKDEFFLDLSKKEFLHQELKEEREPMEESKPEIILTNLTADVDLTIDYIECHNVHADVSAHN